MKPGDLRHRVTIERNAPEAQRQRSPSGQLKDNWQPLVTVWAAKLPPVARDQRGDEFSADAGRFPEMTDVWQIRGGSGVKNTDRLKWINRGTTRHYDILGVADPKGIGQWDILTCKEGKSPGS